jgi:serine/threonine-protein kinase RsbW
MKKSLALKLASDLDELEKMERYVRDIAKMASCGDETRHNIMLVLTEAVTNAILHGNRQQPDKAVDISAEISADRIVLTIQDQGDGFDPKSIPNPLDEKNILKSSGRGVWLMHEFSDKVRFLDGGRKVVLIFDL